MTHVMKMADSKERETRKVTVLDTSSSSHKTKTLHYTIILCINPFSRKTKTTVKYTSNEDS